MDCRNIPFSPEKSQKRTQKAVSVFGRAVLDRILALGLHLQGAPRKTIASILNRSDESIKTSLRVLMRDGLPALRDRRYSGTQTAAGIPMKPTGISIHQQEGCQVIAFGVSGTELRIPLEHKVQLRTVLLSFFNSGLLPVQETATALGISVAHCRELGKNLNSGDVPESLIDKRQGQLQDYRVGPAEKAALIQQFSARAVLHLPTSSQLLAKAVSEETRTVLSPRTIRWHMDRLGLRQIRKTLPALVDVQKKLHGIDR